MKTIFYSLVLIFVSSTFIGCEANSIENETLELEKSDTSTFELVAIDKEDAETIGTRD
ncbi:hypothetical protein [Aquimarina algiphila]|uniref:hypothetical protein n=1 Tax=Aquimarina algiphila TaxID=2047982 RepID=UPI001431E4CB|nr:hypothetical protein [Aquimarina algiphila]